jgi:hypothetical protein
LACLYAELRGKLILPGADRAAIRIDLEHVVAVLRMLDPDFDATAIRPVIRNRPNPYFRRHQAPVIVMQILRAADRPMTTTEIAMAVFAARGVEPTGHEFRNMSALVRFNLLKLVDRTVIRECKGRLVWWSIKA